MSSRVGTSHAEMLREDVIGAFGRIVNALGDDGDIDALLHRIADQMCALFGVRRCSVYLRDNNDGDRFRGRVAHVGRDVDAAIRRLVAGTDADRFTKEILLRREPVLIADALRDPRPVRGTMRAWGVCSMLGVPMLAGDEIVGLLYLDDEDRRVELTADELRLAAVAADLAGAAVKQAQRFAVLRRRTDAESRRNHLHQQTANLRTRLVAMLTSGADLATLAASMATVIKTPVALYDQDGALHASGVPSAADHAAVPADLRHPSVAAALLDASAACTVIGPFPDAGIHHRLSMTPVPGQRGGHVAIVESRGRLGAAEALIGRCAADIFALGLHVANCTSDADAREQRSLARDLLLGRDDADGLRRRAAPYGLGAPEASHVVCLIAPRLRLDPLGTLSADDVHEAFPLPYRRGGLLTAAVDGGIGVFVPVFGDDHREALADAKRTVGEVVAALAPDGALVAALSRRCSRIEDFARARSECDQVMQCFASFVDDRAISVIAADDLGPARLILATGSPAVITRFAVEALGPLTSLSGDNPELLRTLAAYLESGRLVRNAGQALGVHENTVRYRLSKIAKLTGLDVLASSDDELTAQIAVTVMRIQGRIPIPTLQLDEVAA